MIFLLKRFLNSVAWTAAPMTTLVYPGYLRNILIQFLQNITGFISNQRSADNLGGQRIWRSNECSRCYSDVFTSVSRRSYLKKETTRRPMGKITTVWLRTIVMRRTRIFEEITRSCRFDTPRKLRNGERSLTKVIFRGWERRTRWETKHVIAKFLDDARITPCSPFLSDYIES